MIDLRSDTVTKPTQTMRELMRDAEVGDDGRGDDPTVRQLEQEAAALLGKEDALFCNSGTMANFIALLTQVKRNEKIAVDRHSHIYTSEHAIFEEDFFGREAVIIESNEYGIPSIPSITTILSNQPIQLLTLENTIGFAGGTCIPIDVMEEIYFIAEQNKVPMHLDGARLFNAAISLSLPVSTIAKYTDTVMFCLSKGLGAPIGSLLCGSADFIQQARKTRKVLGGNMRQAGIVAAAGIEALHEVDHLKVDHRNARLLYDLIKHQLSLAIEESTIQTNIIKIDISPSNRKAEEWENRLAQMGVLVKTMGTDHLRLVFHRDINKEMVHRAAHQINAICSELNEVQ